MKRGVFFFTLFLIPLILFSCAAPLKDYQPQSPDEVAIKTMLMKMETTWNNKDKTGYLSCFHESAKIMTGRERKAVSKNEYADLLLQRMVDLGPYYTGTPQIKVDGNSAKVKKPYNMGGRNFTLNLDLLRENGQWLVMETSF